MTDASDALVRCEQVGKCYRLYRRPADRLNEDLRAIGARLLGRKFQPHVREHWALRQVSFEVGAGETVAVIGRNGSGKSTLLQTIAGTLTPTEGTVSVRGRVSALLELGVGFHPEFSGLDNIRLTAAVLGFPPDALAARLDSIVAFADIGQYIHLPVKTYSSGMSVRLAFSIAIHSEPELLIVDEVLAVGDIAFQAKCMARIRGFQQSGGSLLFVSHDVAAVRALCHRAIYLDRGRVTSIGPTGEIVDRYLRDLYQGQDGSMQTPAGSFGGRVERQAMAAPAGVVPLTERFNAFSANCTKGDQGTGEAHVRLVEMLDEAGRLVEMAEFDAAVKIRIWVECIRACTVSINYKIRNRHLVPVAGADFLISGRPLLAMESGGLYFVEYATRLPLMDGAYSLRLSITKPIDKHAQAIFIDIVEVAAPFRILPSPLGKIYTNVYLPNTVSVRELTGEAIHPC
jgi:lipopolysaccharide transport system ATP-binding protein